ncbi:MAG: ABC transporter permease [Lachnospiraceae bacterium]|nr:ABC transporter permease [Clostridiales bacterium]MCD7715540.1 ABC transporter permease [Lachnospiraceae bacterium]MCD7762170.1 ABC transporter permease [Lachnospiraceae bacterium]MCD7841452.1 ABC transporter permease [Lachnospiraceae bacterium]MCD7882833.1 ABC transporter permease [Lachnospiraceae bacterium]
MWKYIVKRLLWSIVIMVGAGIIIFLLTYFTPGDPAAQLIGSDASAADLAALRAKLGIDKPFLQQLVTFLYNSFIKWDWGTSWTYNEPVMSTILSRLPRTAIIGVGQMILTVAIGIPLGIFAARHQGHWQDYGVLGVCMVLVSLPDMWVALMFVLLFSLQLHWLPAYGIGGPQYYILPIVSGVMGGIAGQARLMRSGMLEVIHSDFVTTARAKGQSEDLIVRKHILPNALMPVITMLGGSLALVVCGSAIVERLFSIPGVGLYLLDGISYRDYPIIRGCTLFFATFSALVYLLLDLVYAWIDPRIKAQYTSGKKSGR